ncbi:hypothetical protein OAQ71_00635, partial [bacterium]|nr:hypothetical protein [bacterium]
VDVLSASYNDDKIAWYENLTFTDCNGNGVSDLADISAGTSVDCNANGIPDECEIANGSEADCNGNGTLDSCEISAGAPDCNGNGLLDSCELSTGAALDCNGNGTPDECDIAAGLLEDCDGNGIPDQCELASGTAADCNSNGILDSCEIASGTATDCDGNGIPDSCQLVADPSFDLNGNGVFDPCEAIGSTYCSPATANSTGNPGTVTVLGNTTIFLNNVQLTARQLPASSFGFFITSLTQGVTTNVPNSQGTLCLAGSVGRFVGPGQIQNSGAIGAISLGISLNSHPTPTGLVSVLPGETWNYQLWHRDAVGGQTTSNFTDAVAVTFQ